MLHFAYGSNMSRALMGARCPTAEPLGTATLRGWRFVINPDGFGSLTPRPGGVVRGVLWRLNARDLAAVNAYESIGSGLYLRRLLPVRSANRQTSALVYIARRQGEGMPRPGYLELVIAAARDWNLPEPYIRALGRWAPSGFRGARARDTGEVE
jgi:cation transport regulator ChaC